MKRRTRGTLSTGGILATFLITGCGAGSETDPESIHQQDPAFTTLMDAQSWCIGVNGNNPPPRTFSGTSHAAAFYAEIRSIEAAVVSSTYTDSTTSQINESTGMYNVDCSSFTDYTMCDTMVDTLVGIGGTGRPRAVGYYNWITGGGSGITRITDVRTIHAGDIIAVKYPTGGCASVTGHVMVAGGSSYSVGDTVSSLDAGRSRYDVPVYDATSTPTHTSDFRVGAIGGGIVSFTYDDNYAPTAFYWSTNASTPSPTACYPTLSSIAIGRFSD